MKANLLCCIRFFTTASILALLPLAVYAEEKAKPAPEVQASSETNADSMNDESLKALSREDVRTLIRLTSIPNDKLVSLRQSIERLEKMTPEEKRVLRQRLEKLREANDKEREKIAEQVNAQRPPKGNFLVRYWHSLPPEKAKEEVEKFKKMTDEERRAYVTEVRKKMPPPTRDAGKAQPERNRGNEHSSEQERPKRDYEPFRPNQSPPAGDSKTANPAK